jgi:hypothetical protein
VVAVVEAKPRGDAGVTGISAAELLAALPRGLRGFLRPSDLTAWLLRERLAVEADGLLVPTPRARALAADLRFLS